MSWQEILDSNHVGIKPSIPSKVERKCTSEGFDTFIPRTKKKATIKADPLRWPRFVALCTAHGVTEDEVRAMFTDQDIEDLCEEPDSKLAKHTATIVAAIKRATRHKDETQEKARTYTTLVRCGRCQHFERNPQNPCEGLGECTKRVDVAMGVPARRIECGQYQERPRT